MEVYGQHHDLEQVRALLGHSRIETTQVYARIQPAELKAAVNFYESRVLRIASLGGAQLGGNIAACFRKF
jgi:hypothetical protein